MRHDTLPLDGMARVEANAGAAWIDAALAAVLTLARQRREFTAEDVWAAGLERPRELRALGPVLFRARVQGWIERSGEVAPVRMHSAQSARTQPIWKSLICETQ